MLVVMDSIKDTKACLNNDFATYKRAFQHCRADIPNADSITQENTLLQPFLANRESLLTHLKESSSLVGGSVCLRRSCSLRLATSSSSSEFWRCRHFS